MRSFVEFKESYELSEEYRRDVQKKLKKAGFTKKGDQGKGSHETWEHASGTKTTVPYKVHKQLANVIMKQAGIKHKF